MCGVFLFFFASRHLCNHQPESLCTSDAAAQSQKSLSQHGVFRAYSGSNIFAHVCERGSIFLSLLSHPAQINSC